MRRTLAVILVMVALLAPTWATGQEESRTLVLAIDSADAKNDAAGGKMLYGEWLSELFTRKTGAAYTLREIVATGGQTTTIDMVLASGEQIDVITGYAGRMSKWATPAWALPISDYVSSDYLAKYVPGALDPYYRVGKLYALPGKAWVQGIDVNVDLIKSLGMADKLPKPDSMDRSWALADFEEMAKRAKAKGIYAMTLFATQPSGDYWQQAWLTGFGAELWRDGHIALNSTEGIAAVKWLVSMQEYAPPGSAGNTYNEMLTNFKAGKTIASGGSPGGWGNGFEWMFVLPPSVPGKKGKVILGPDSALVVKTTKSPGLAVELAKSAVGMEMQTLQCSDAAAFPTMLGIPGPVDKPVWTVGAGVLADAGPWDAGIPNQAYSKVREMWLTCLQSLFLGRATVEDAVAKFQTDANAFIDAQ